MGGALSSGVGTVWEPCGSRVGTLHAKRGGLVLRLKRELPRAPRLRDPGDCQRRVGGPRPDRVLPHASHGRGAGYAM